jgi:hypothetical protein
LITGLLKNANSVRRPAFYQAELITLGSPYTPRAGAHKMI